ncbi:MAG: DUF1330 domain-containing protein [Pseudomonadota bacterium]
MHTKPTPAVLPTLKAHNAENLAANYASETVEGQPGTTVIIIFASKAAAHTWYPSPEYRAILGLHTDNSEVIAMLAIGFNLKDTLSNLDSR